jgi:hypothetical protein
MTRDRRRPAAHAVWQRPLARSNSGNPAQSPCPPRGRSSVRSDRLRARLSQMALDPADLTFRQVSDSLFGDPGQSGLSLFVVAEPGQELQALKQVRPLRALAPGEDHVDSFADRADSVYVPVLGNRRGTRAGPPRIYPSWSP